MALKLGFLRKNTIVWTFIFVILTAKTNAVLHDECILNLSNGFPCDHVDLEKFVPGQDMVGSSLQKLSDIWGWTDPETGKEYALTGLQDGTAFVDLSNPEEPKYVGFLAAHDGKNAPWRDIKTYSNYAYIVADAFDHGMQIFDLTELRNVTNTPVMFQETAHFEIVGKAAKSQEEFAKHSKGYSNHKFSDEGYAHNIAINEESGFAYLMGSNRCNLGLFMVNLGNPLVPTEAGCFSSWGLIHDAQCVTYDGPDSDYTNREICFVSYYVGFGIIDVTNRSNPKAISFVEESYFGKIDQGWWTEDKGYFLIGDTVNEIVRTHIVDVSNLDFIAVRDTYISNVIGRFSNMFVYGGYAYQATHRGGLRILALNQVSTGNLIEVGYFDTSPALSGEEEDANWGVYPFFESGIVILSSVDEGLFIVFPTKTTKMPTISPSPTMIPPSSSPSSTPIDPKCLNSLVRKAMTLSV